jgi:murein DD-endopeptidase MepM/ murein hydrolase activator NlpD
MRCVAVGQLPVAILLFTASFALQRAAPPQTRVDAGLTITARARAVRPGELVVLTITAPGHPASMTVRVFGREAPTFQVDAATWRALVGIDLETAPRTYSVEVAAGDPPDVRRGSHQLVVAPRQFRTRTLTVDPAFVNPSSEALERIGRETAELNDLWAHSSSTKLWDGPFVRPVPDAANSAFGTRSILNGESRSPHSGADFNSPAGTPIKAPGAGRVVLAGDRYFTGNTVMIDHGLTLFSLFAHLSEIQVKTGDLVNTGDIVGKVGATGRVTGLHLHWSVRLNGARIDPLSLLTVLGRSK